MVAGVFRRRPDRIRRKLFPYTVGKATVNKDSQLVWDINNFVNKDTQLVWDIRNLVNKSTQLVWDMGGIVGRSVQLIWDIKPSLGGDIIRSLHLRFRSRISLGK